MVEAVTLEHGHDAAVLHAAVFHDEVKDELFHRRSFVDGGEAVLLHHVGNGEEGAGIEPARNVVMRGVEVKALGRDAEHAVLQVFEVADAHTHHAGLRVAYHKVAEAEVVHDGLAEVHGQFLRVFVDERAVEILHLVGIGDLRTLYDNGNVWVDRAHIA